jgi:hypothetical protein
LMVIFSHGTRLHRNQKDTGMMVPATRATRPDGNLGDSNISLSLSCKGIEPWGLINL